MKKMMARVNLLPKNTRTGADILCDGGCGASGAVAFSR